MKPLIVAENIQRIYGTGSLAYHVLKGVYVSVSTGEFLAIMGKSGAGKSTLLYQLSGLDHPNEGSIMIEGHNIMTMSEDDLVSFRLNTLAYVFQDYALVPELDARENVMLPILMRGIPWNEAKKIAQDALARVGLHNKDTHLPAELSGGEQQRVSVARAIAGKPKILFADEPTANLDSVSGKAIIDILKELHHDGQTIVMVTHEEEYARVANRIIYLEDGKIVNEIHNTEHTPGVAAEQSMPTPVSNSEV